MSKLKLMMMAGFALAGAAQAAEEPADYKCEATKHEEGRTVERAEFTLDRNSSQHTYSEIRIGDIRAYAQSSGTLAQQGVSAGIVLLGPEEHLSISGATAITYDSVGFLYLNFRESRTIHYVLRCRKNQQS